MGSPSFITRIVRSLERNASLLAFREPHDRIDQILFPAIILDTLAFTHCYIVQADFAAAIVATAMTPGCGTAVTGYRDYGLYTPGQKVLCWQPPLSTQAYILGPLNNEASYPDQLMSDAVQQGTGVTFLDELVHRYLAHLPPLGFIKQFNNHRPTDSFTGERGFINALGMGLHLGLHMVYLRAGEQCGHWLFYNDKLMRTVAHNYQLWTAHREAYSGNDETELNSYHRSSPFYWEMAGAPSYLFPLHRHTDPVWKQGQADCQYEPKEVDQTGIYRFHSFEGYLGDMKRELVSCPPQNMATLETYKARTRHIGLSDFTRHSNGAISLRTAKSFSIEKTLLIPVPKQLRAPDDPAGDQLGDKSYKYAGTVGEGGAAHDQTEFTWGNPAPAARACQLLDYHAWLFNSYANAGFQNHAKDWYLPQERELAADLGPAVDPKVFKPLGLKYAGDLPESLPLVIDSRPGNTHRYYRTRAGFTITDEGGLVLYDGFGSELRFAGGNGEVTCQGDFLVRTGRNVQLWAPRDLVLKAGNDADLTASKGSVRVKAEENLHVLAGNGGKGGLLLESRSKGFAQSFNGVGSDVVSSGIVLLSRQSEIDLYGARLYLRSLNRGDLTLDADAGQGDVNIFAGDRFETVKGQVVTAYGIYPTEYSLNLTVEIHNAGQVIFSQPNSILLAAQEIVAYRASIWAGAEINALEGFNQATVGRQIGTLISPTPENIRGRAADLEQVVVTSQELRQGLETVYYSTPECLGNAELIAQLGFSLRSDDQYGVTEFAIYEARWQQAFRQAGAGGVWEEPEVTSPQGRPTRPFPGHKNWSEVPVYFTVDPTLWNSTNGYNADRCYAAPQGSAPRSGLLATTYRINIQKR